MQIKGEQGVQEQATAWQDIIAAKKEAVGLQVENCFYPSLIIIIAHFDSRVNRKVVLFPKLGKELINPWLTAGGRIQKQACRCPLRRQEEAGLPGFHLPSVLLVSNRTKNGFP